MTYSEPGQSGETLSGKTIALIVYILYFAGYFIGITWLIGVIVAHVKVGTADPVLASHFRFQIRTFWIGLLYLLIGVLTLVVMVGALVLIWWLIWTLIRNIKGVLALNENRPIADPASWMFG